MVCCVCYCSEHDASAAHDETHEGGEEHAPADSENK